MKGVDCIVEIGLWMIGGFEEVYFVFGEEDEIVV